MLPIIWKNEFLPLARRHRDRIAVVDEDGEMRFGELFDAAAGIAEAILDHGIEPGQRVASYVPNSRRAVATSYGVTLTGAAEASINPSVSLDEAAHCLAISQASLVLTTRDRLAALRPLAPAVLAVEDLPAGNLETLPEVQAEPAIWGRIIFTSGTTGKPKGIVYSHAGRWTANLLLRATLPVAPTPGRQVLLMTPFSHGAGLQTYAFLDGGASVRLYNGIDPQRVTDALTQGLVDQIFAPPTVLAKIVSLLGERRIGGISAIFTGTAPLSAELYAKARQIFGPVVRVTYGKSEVFNPITVLTPEETDAWYSGEGPRGICVGWPASGVEVRIGEPDTDSDAPTQSDDGEPIGPVLLRARHMLVGTLTQAGFEPHPDGAYHRTGDLGFIDAEGRLQLCGREADVMKTGGYRVTPEEIEIALRPHLAHGEIVVIGLPSTYWGEVITAVAVGAAPEWRDRLAPALERLTPYKRPKLYAELPEMPRNAMGKIVRSRVREAVLASHVYEDDRYPSLTPVKAADKRC